MGWNHQLVMIFVQEEGGFHEGNPANISLGWGFLHVFGILKALGQPFSKGDFRSATPLEPEHIKLKPPKIWKLGGKKHNFSKAPIVGFHSFRFRGLSFLDF